ncbi:hypothetical protein HN937_12295 [Candidatus Poribacteria bacterium]|nr:hypothetical protein [Candidatus Poribacteria bacterium]
MNVQSMTAQAQDVQTGDGTGDVLVSASCAYCGADKTVRIEASRYANARRCVGHAQAMMQAAGLELLSGVTMFGEWPSWTEPNRIAMALALRELPERCGCPQEDGPPLGELEPEKTKPKGKGKPKTEG